MSVLLTILLPRCIECRRGIAMRILSIYPSSVCTFVCLSNACIVTQETHQEIEIAKVNFLYDDIVHVLQNTISSVTDRRSYVLERMFTKFSETTQYNGHYAVQGHSGHRFWYQSKAHIRLPIIE